jgi:hypothetical protein
LAYKSARQTLKAIETKLAHQSQEVQDVQRYLSYLKKQTPEKLILGVASIYQKNAGELRRKNPFPTCKAFTWKLPEKMQIVISQLSGGDLKKDQPKLSLSASTLGGA